jgi:hypothetical protein
VSAVQLLQPVIAGHAAVLRLLPYLVTLFQVRIRTACTPFAYAANGGILACSGKMIKFAFLFNFKF